MLKRYLDEQEGAVIGDVWTDISQLRANNRESLGYPTQKPIALLERIVEMSSQPGDVVLDPFCGCGTAIAAAQKLERQWIGIDITHLAIALIKNRLVEIFPELGAIKTVGEPTDLGGARALANVDRYQFQWWALSLVRARPSGIAVLITLEKPTAAMRREAAEAGDYQHAFADAHYPRLQILTIQELVEEGASVLMPPPFGTFKQTAREKRPIADQELLI